MWYLSRPPLWPRSTFPPRPVAAPGYQPQAAGLAAALPWAAGLAVVVAVVVVVGVAVGPLALAAGLVAAPPLAAETGPAHPERHGVGKPVPLGGVALFPEVLPGSWQLPAAE